MSQDERTEEHKEDNNLGQTSSTSYQIRQKMVSTGNDYWIENEQGEQVYKLDGKAMRMRKIFVCEDAHGNKLAVIEKLVLSIKETMEVKGPKGEQLALVKQDLFTSLRDNFVVKVKNGPNLEVRGDLLDHKYSICDGRNKVAEVSKKWFSLRDSYRVSIEPGHNDVIILAVVVCIDQMTYAGP